MTIYDEMQDIVRELLTEFNQGIKFYVDIAPGNGPVDDPGPAVETPYDIVGTATGVSFKYVQQGLAVATDLQLIAPVDLRYTPDMRGFILIKKTQNDIGLKYKIVQILNKPAVGTAVARVFIFQRSAP